MNNYFQSVILKFKLQSLEMIESEEIDTFALSSIFLPISSQCSFSSRFGALLYCWMNSSVTSNGFLKQN